MKIGQAIKDIRKHKDIKQYELATAIGISQTSLSQIEADLKYPHTKTLKKIAKAFDIPEQLIYFLSIKDSDVPKSKKELYVALFPIVKDLIYRIID